MKLMKPVLGTRNRLLIPNLGLQIMNWVVLNFSVLNNVVLVYKIIDSYCVMHVFDVNTSKEILTSDLCAGGRLKINGIMA